MQYASLIHISHPRRPISRISIWTSHIIDFPGAPFASPNQPYDGAATTTFALWVPIKINYLQRPAHIARCATLELTYTAYAQHRRHSIYLVVGAISIWWCAAKKVSGCNNTTQKCSSLANTINGTRSKPLCPSQLQLIRWQMRCTLCFVRRRLHVCPICFAASIFGYYCWIGWKIRLSPYCGK